MRWRMAGGGVRLAALRQQLARTPTLPVDDPVVEAFAHLFAECIRTGHALHQKAHVGDRWIAASAIAVDLPLLTGDGAFRGAPGLTLWDEVSLS